MIDTPQVTQSDGQLTAVIRFTIPRHEIRNVMGPGINELLAAVTAQNVPITGAVFSHHLRMDPEVFDFEVGIPTGGIIGAAGRVKPSELLPAKVIRTVYRGGYEGLGAAWGEFDLWIAENGYATGADLWECYVSGPDKNPDPTTFRTELNRPLLAGA